MTQMLYLIGMAITASVTAYVEARRGWEDFDPDNLGTGSSTRIVFFAFGWPLTWIIAPSVLLGKRAAKKAKEQAAEESRIDKTLRDAGLL